MTDTTPSTGPVQQETGVLQHLDPAALVIETNVRTEGLTLEAEFVDSVRTHGVLVPVLLARHRRGRALHLLGASLPASFGSRGTARGFGRLALSWPATSADAASEPPTHNLKRQLCVGGSEVQVAGQDRARKNRGMDGWVEKQL